MSDIDHAQIANLLESYGMAFHVVEPGQSIPGSFWGDCEAGLITNRLYARADTPVHSVLHEACHWICMDPARREGLHTNAGGDYDEENAVCYLQILLADHLPGFGRARCLRDMDAWGYSFRLGSAGAWFEDDAQDAREWLAGRGIIEMHANPTCKINENRKSGAIDR